LELREIWYGLKLQLMAYLAVALEGAGALVGGASGTPQEFAPAAVFYFPLKDPLVSAGPALGVSADAVEEEILKEMRPSGLALADPKVITALDGRVNEGSVLLPAGLKAGKEVKGAPALSPKAFQRLLEYAKAKMAAAGDKILGGANDISPCQCGSFAACRRCSYRPVCQFDPLLQGKKRRVLPRLSGEEVLDLVLSWEGVSGSDG